MALLSHFGSPLRAGYLALVVGIMIFGFGLFWAGRTWLFVQSAEHVPARIVDRDFSQGRSRDAGGIWRVTTSVHVIVEYTDFRGQNWRVRSSRAGEPASGDGQVMVFYDPADPGDMLLDVPWLLWFAPGVWVVLGGVWSGLTGLLVLKLRSWEAEKTSRAVTSAFGEQCCEVFYDVTSDADIHGEAGGLDASLARRLKREGTAAALVIGVDEKDVVLQSRSHILRVPRAAIRHLSVHPVLPAKSSGMVVLVLGTEVNGQKQARTLAMTNSGYRKGDLDDMIRKARRLALLLGVPVTVEAESYDC